MACQMQPVQIGDCGGSKGELKIGIPERGVVCPKPVDGEGLTAARPVRVSLTLMRRVRRSHRIGTCEEALDTACGLYLYDPTAWT